MSTWEEVLKRTDLVGGDLETQEDGVVYRGPIESVTLENGQVKFVSPWTARMDPRSGPGEWEAWHINTMWVDARMCPPNEIGDGRIAFNIIALGIGVIFPKGGSKLDPKKVKGLDLTKVQS